MRKYLIPIILLLLGAVHVDAQTVNERFSGYGVIQGRTGTGPSYTLNIVSFQGSPRFQPNGTWLGTDVLVGDVVWIDCGRYVITAKNSAGISSMNVTVQIPAADVTAGVTAPPTGQVCAVMRELPGAIPAFPLSGDNAGSGIPITLMSCILNHYAGIPKVDSVRTTSSSGGVVVKVNTISAPAVEIAPGAIAAGGATNGQVLKFNGTDWAAGTDNNSGGGSGGNLYALDTVTQTAHGFRVMDAVLDTSTTSTSKFIKGNTSNQNLLPSHLVVDSLSSNTFVVQRNGYVKKAQTRFTARQVYYLRDNGSYASTPDSTYNFPVFAITSSTTPIYLTPIVAGNSGGGSVTTSLPLTGTGTLGSPVTLPINTLDSNYIKPLSLVNSDIANLAPNKLLQSGATPGQVITWDGLKYAPSAPIPYVNITGTSAADESYPLTQVFEQIFSDNSTGVLGFNGGVVGRNADSTCYIRVTAGGGLLINYTLTPGQKYILQFNIKEIKKGLRVYEEWADFIDGTAATDTVKTVGLKTYKFLLNNDGNGDNKPVIVLTEPDTVKIDDIRIYLCDPETRLIQDRYEANDTLNARIASSAQQALLYRNDFSASAYGVTFTNTTGVITNGKLKVSNIGPGKVVTFSAGKFPDTCSFSVTVKIDEISGPLLLRAVWGEAAVDTIKKPGVYSFSYTRAQPSGPAALNGFSISGTVTGSTVTFDAIEISGTTLASSYYTNDYHITMGEGAITAGLQRLDGAIQIGSFSNNNARQDAVIIGEYASATGDNTFGTFGGGFEQIAIGERSKSYGWRATAVGAKAHAAAQSSTAIGAGAWAATTHGVALGRGAKGYTVPSGLTGNSIFAGAENLFLANAWAHAIPNPPTGMELTGGGAVSISNLENKIYGRCAYDARYPAWSADTTYSAGRFVWHSNASYYSKTITTNNIPSSSTTQWLKITDDTGGAIGSYNVSAGNLGLYGGLATGSGTSGAVRFYIGTGNNGQNTQDTAQRGGEFRGAESQTTHTYFYLLDASNNTLYQVKIGAAGTGPGGSGRALYID